MGVRARGCGSYLPSWTRGMSCDGRLSWAPERLDGVPRRSPSRDTDSKVITQW